MIPAANKARPTGATSNNSNCPSVAAPGGSEALDAIIRSFNRISGDEPTMVMVPPMMAQKPIGISRRDSGISVRTDIRDTTGRNNAVAPTFCIRLDIPPTVPEINGIIRLAVFPPIRKINAATTVITPVRSRPAPSIITAMMDITALEAKPLNS